MALETATYIKDLVSTNPPSTDFVSQGDDHIRLIKSVLQSTFPALCGPASPTVGGTANAITLTYLTAPGSNLANEVIYFTPTAANTGPATISVNGNTALPVLYQGAALVGGELQPSRIYQAITGASAAAFHLIANAALPITGGTMSGNISFPSNFGVNFNGANQRILSTGLGGSSLANANLIVQSFDGIGFETSCVGQIIPVGLNSAIIASRTGQIISSGQLTVRDVTDNHVSNIGLLRIYQHSNVQYLEVVSNSYVPSLDPTTPIVAGGSGIAANDRFYDANNNTYTVLTVTAGAAATIRMDAVAQFTGTPPANPVALTAAPGFAGTGLTVNLNWTPPTELNMRCTGTGITSIGVAGGTTNIYGTVSSTVTHAGGISFGSVVAPGGVLDLSKHIALFGTTYGFSVTSAAINVVTAGVLAATFTGGGINGLIGNSTQSTGRFTGLFLDNAAGTQRSLVGRTGTSSRWNMVLGNATAEGGSNVGSDFQLSRYTDAAVLIDSPLTITRSTGIAAFTQSPTAPTPTVGDNSTQLATTAFVTTAAGAYLPLAGGTLTGTLTITANGGLAVAPASGGATVGINTSAAAAHNLQGSVGGQPRWIMSLGNPTAESGSNAGSDFSIINYSDAGAIIGSSLTIERKTGYVSINGIGATLQAASGAASGVASLRLNSATGNQMQIVSQMNGLARWNMGLGNGTTETGGNVGSDFVISRFNDAGASIDTPLTITRSNGQTTFAGTVLCTSPGSQLTVSGATATNRVLNFSTGGSGRWQHVCTAGAESGSNAGSDYVFQALTDTGTVLGQVWSVVRSTQIVTFTKAIVNGPSDRSMKENVAPLKGSLDKVLALQGVSFNMIGDEDKRKQIGLIAQDVEPIVPEVIQDFRSTVPAADEKGEPVEIHKLALDYPKLTALLIEAVKELTTRVTQLEAKLAGG